MFLEFHMPLWAIIYCGFILANGLLTIYLNPDKRVLYIAAQLMSTFFTIAFFFFYYQVLTPPQSVATILLMLIFILYQETFANKALYKKMIFDTIPPSERKATLYFIALTMIIFLLPFFYVTFGVIKSYF